MRACRPRGGPWRRREWASCSTSPAQPSAARSPSPSARRGSTARRSRSPRRPRSSQPWPRSPGSSGAAAASRPSWRDRGIAGGVVLVERARLPRRLARAAKPAPRARRRSASSSRATGRRCMTEYAPYGVRHFLRQLDPEGASELRRRLDPAARRSGGSRRATTPTSTISSSTESSSTARSCSCTRPRRAAHPRSTGSSGAGATTTSGSARSLMATRILEHLPLGDDSQPAAVPACSEVLRLGRAAAAQWPPRRRRAAARHGRRSLRRRPPSVVAGGPAAAREPSTHRVRARCRPRSPFRRRALRLLDRRLVPAPAIELSVDGRKLATAQNHLNHPGVDTPLGETELTAGCTASPCTTERATSAQGAVERRSRSGHWC